MFQEILQVKGNQWPPLVGPMSEDIVEDRKSYVFPWYQEEVKPRNLGLLPIRKAIIFANNCKVLFLIPCALSFSPYYPDGTCFEGILCRTPAGILTTQDQHLNLPSIYVSL